MNKLILITALLSVSACSISESESRIKEIVNEQLRLNLQEHREVRSLCIKLLKLVRVEEPTEERHFYIDYNPGIYEKQTYSLNCWITVPWVGYHRLNLEGLKTAIIKEAAK